MFQESILENVYYILWALQLTFTNIPVPPENITVTYELYTPENPNATTINDIEEVEINTEHELKILCHGWTHGDYTTNWYNYTIEEYLKKGNVSVITTNYEDFVKRVDYYNASIYASYIGGVIGNFTLGLNRIKGVQFEKVHIIGHLIGAHIAGVIGETVYEKSGKYIDRITGIDPINLGYLDLPPVKKLHKDNAKFVDIMLLDTYVPDKPNGRVNFFGNSYMVRCGRRQYTNKQIGPLYFANSINGANKIIAVKCKNKYGNFFSRVNCNENATAVLGENIDRGAFGDYYMKYVDISKYACRFNNVTTTVNRRGK